MKVLKCNDDPMQKIKSVFGSKSTVELEKNIKFLQKEARADAEMQVSLAGSERMSGKEAIKILKDILKNKNAMTGDTI